MADGINGGEGLRERKRKETAARITEAALKLFVAKGYDATTLDDIAAEADISRRGFFHYFPSKDDILLSLQRDLGAVLAEAVRQQSDHRSPLVTIRDVVAEAAAAYPTKRALLIDKIMRSSTSIQARKAAAYIEHEQVVLAALRERWPAPSLDLRLRLIAMQAIGAIRLSTDAFSNERGRRSLPVIVHEHFAGLDLSALPG